MCLDQSTEFANSNGYNSENIYAYLTPCWKAKICFGGLNLFLKIVNKQLKNENKWRPPKHILALPTWGQKCIFSEL